MKTKQHMTDLTNGPIIKSLLLFTLPILLGNLLQQLYNVVDTAVIGHFLGDNALASIGAAGPIYELILGITSGFGNGFSVLIARYFGAQEEENLKKTVSWTYYFSFMIAIIITIIGLFGIRPLLIFLNTPVSIIDDTVCYMQIIIGFSIITIFYNMFAGMLRAIGNSRIPLYFLGIATILNVFLDIFFVKDLHLGVAGAGYATIIAQFVCTILCILYVYKKCPFLCFDKHYLSKDIALITDLFVTGLSMSLMYVVVSIGSVALQSSVNSFGEQTIAAHNAARKIDNALMLPIVAINTSSATFTSQNYGAGKMQRVKKGLSSSLILCCFWSIFAVIISYIFGKQFIVLLTGSQDSLLIRTAFQYIKINILFLPALSVLIVLRSSLQGMGQKLVPLLASVIELIFKFIAVGFIAPVLGYFGICILEPIIWVVCAIVVFVDYLIFIHRNNS